MDDWWSSQHHSVFPPPPPTEPPPPFFIPPIGYHPYDTYPSPYQAAPPPPIPLPNPNPTADYSFVPSLGVQPGMPSNDVLEGIILPSSSNWSCPQCTYDNPPNQKSCEICGWNVITSPTRSNIKNTNNHNPPYWTCSWCTFHNTIEVGIEDARCEMCGNAASSKDNTPPMIASSHLLRSLPQAAPPVPKHPGEGMPQVRFDKQLQDRLLRNIPNRFRGGKFDIVYSSRQDGTSTRTLITKCFNNTVSPLLFVVSCVDAPHRLFGTFVAVPLSVRQSRGYQGSGETFVWTAGYTPLGGWSVEVYPWSRRNEHFVCLDRDSLSFGGGGSSALYIGSGLTEGTTGPCATFSSPCLCPEKPDFDIVSLEVYTLRV